MKSLAQTSRSWCYYPLYIDEIGAQRGAPRCPQSELPSVGIGFHAQSWASLTTTLYEEPDLEPCFLARAANAPADRCSWEQWAKSTVSSFSQDDTKAVQQGQLRSLLEGLPETLFVETLLDPCSLRMPPLSVQLPAHLCLSTGWRSRGRRWLSGNSRFISVAKVVTQLSCIVLFSITQAVRSRLPSPILL